MSQPADHILELASALANGRFVCCESCRANAVQALSAGQIVWFEHELCANEYNSFRVDFISRHSAWVG